MLNRHVYIIGMPGSGKSSLGRRVASNLGLPFIDTDQRIEQSVGCSTSDIFAHYGEQAFRNAETNMLIKLNRRPLLAQKGLGEVERLYHERIDLYRKAADATLDNSHGYQAGMYGLQKLITTMFNIYA